MTILQDGVGDIGLQADTAKSIDAGASILVVYEGGPHDRFDRDYWVQRHFPLARSIWEIHGPVGTVATFSDVEAGRFVATVIITFRNDEAMAAALASPENVRISGDFRNFTDLIPRQFRLSSLG